jgi:hypothetical protein
MQVLPLLALEVKEPFIFLLNLLYIYRIENESFLVWVVSKYLYIFFLPFLYSFSQLYTAIWPLYMYSILFSFLSCWVLKFLLHHFLVQLLKCPLVNDFGIIIALQRGCSCLLKQMSWNGWCCFFFLLCYDFDLIDGSHLFIKIHPGFNLLFG